MRPPAIQAERAFGRDSQCTGLAASMRPPAIQAERPLSPPPELSQSICFNEAACNTGGTLPGAETMTLKGQLASMRPPAIQAERHGACLPEQGDDAVLQ